MNLLKQKENVANLLQMIKENPDLPIIPMVETECIFDDSYAFWMAKWSNAVVTKFWCSDERIYEYDDFYELVENWVDDNYEDYKELSDEELTKLAEDKINSHEWVDAIIVYIRSI